MAKVLVVDDNEDTLSIVREILEHEGHDVFDETTGTYAVNTVRDTNPDVILLDIDLPGLDGLEICKRIRSDPAIAKIPILFITASAQDEDIIVGLKAGADDYVVKPFNLAELSARVQASLRRAPGNQLDTNSSWISLGDLRLHDTIPQVQICDNEPVDLTYTEHRFLYTLMIEAGQAVSLGQLLQRVWDYPPHVGNANIVHVTVKRLRAKLEENPQQPNIILTVRGHGYMVNGKSKVANTEAAGASV